MESISNEMMRLASYISEARRQTLPEEVQRRGKLHVLDTMAAVISGGEMAAGRVARHWADGVFGEGNSGIATIFGGGKRVPPFAAALCNGMAAHADETDDSHMESHSHPGCSIVPAALAAAEDVDASGIELIQAVVAGYDCGCRISRSSGMAHIDLTAGQHSSHALVGAFGSAAAASVLYGLTPTQIRYVLSYTAQLVSGVTSWMRDTAHVEKAFVFGGMPASQGMQAVSLVRAGGTGVEDVFSGSPNWLEAVSLDPDRTLLSKGLGEDFEILRGTLKKYSVGSPAQAAVEAVVRMIEEEGLTTAGVERIRIQLPSNSAMIVDSRTMPSINVQYLVAGTLLDGKFSFAMAHDEGRMKSPEIVELIRRTELISDESIKGTRQAVVTVETNHGDRSVTHTRHVVNVRGTSFMPMSVDEVRTKTVDLIEAITGQKRAVEICDRVLCIEREDSIRSLISDITQAL